MQEDSIVHLRLHTLKLAKCRIQLPKKVPKYNFLALGTPSKSLNQEFSLYPCHCLSSKLLDYLLSFSAFQPPDRSRVVPLSMCVYYCMLLRKSVQWARSSEPTLSLVPILHQPYLLAPWLFSLSLNKEASFAGAQGLYWNGGTMSWIESYSDTGDGPGSL